MSSVEAGSGRRGPCGDAGACVGAQGFARRIPPTERRVCTALEGVVTLERSSQGMLVLLMMDCRQGMLAHSDPPLDPGP